MEDLFRHFWWIIFPIFGMGMGVYGMWIDHRRRRDAIDLLKVYAQKGAEPPPELTRVMAQMADPWGLNSTNSSGRYNELWSMATFLALCAGFSFAAYAGPAEAAWAFVMVAIIMGIFAIGALIIVLVKLRDLKR
ncbi:MAG: hypothetical protein IT546_04860 [Caulobacteraceae bacterium]|nr:hypothetical protein [Caulobacteraceae bacterium]